MNRRSFLLASAGTALTAVLGAQASKRAPRRPNVIIIFTDDQGFADLGCQGQREDIRTPNLDRMAAEGVRCTDGYITAPQCTPSRAGIITGRYQQRFGVHHIPDGPLPLTEVTVADRLTAAGYKTGMVGKWHLEPTVISHKWAKTLPKTLEKTPQGHLKIPFEDSYPYYPQKRGFAEVFKGHWKRWHANYALDGSALEPGGEWVDDTRFRLDVQSDAAVTFIERNKEGPFFLYLAYFAPHTPLESPEKYLSKFPGEMPTRRRYALAMISAIDQGVGRILDKLKEAGIDEDTLVFYTSDNGAPLKMTKDDNPIDQDPGGWDGSLNEPWVGEKGMLAEGGIRVPFLARWKGVLPEGKTYSEPVISLDMTATALSVAGLPVPEELDGVDLLPYLTGKRRGAPHKCLYWRFWAQTAIRSGKWKYLQAGGKARYLFDLSSPKHEHVNLIEEQPRIAKRLRRQLAEWTAELDDPGIPDGELNVQEKSWYKFYFGLES